MGVWIVHRFRRLAEREMLPAVASLIDSFISLPLDEDHYFHIRNIYFRHGSDALWAWY